MAMLFQIPVFAIQVIILTGIALIPFIVASRRPVKANTCQYENITYSARQTFKPDPCTFCKCPRKGGEARCAIMDCKWEPHCLKHDKDPTVCCPRCLEYGCLHSDGKVYKKGALVTGGNCSRCYCPASGGRTVCLVRPCPHARCVDYIISKTTCCPVCPNGPNCQYKGTIIAAGKVVEFGNRRCRCQRLMWSGGTKLFASCWRKFHRRHRV